MRVHDCGQTSELSAHTYVSMYMLVLQMPGKYGVVCVRVCECVLEAHGCVGMGVNVYT